MSFYGTGRHIGGYGKDRVMWHGVIPAVTTKFTEDNRLDHAEMELCFALQMDAG